eukprot:SAG31_NODE_634_length_13365_cov_182.161767_5_plen_56_part_00
MCVSFSQQLLDLVGVGYLVIRWGNDNVNDVVAELGWDHVCRWEDVLVRWFLSLRI